MSKSDSLASTTVATMMMFYNNGQPRTIAQISELLDGPPDMDVRQAVTKLVEDGFLVVCDWDYERFTIAESEIIQPPRHHNRDCLMT